MSQPGATGSQAQTGTGTGSGMSQPGATGSQAQTGTGTGMTQPGATGATTPGQPGAAGGGAMGQQAGQMDESQIRDLLRERGYTNVTEVEREGQNFTAKARQGDREVNLRIDPQTRTVTPHQN
jgi:hypothetical protein